MAFHSPDFSGPPGPNEQLHPFSGLAGGPRISVRPLPAPGPPWQLPPGPVLPAQAPVAAPAVPVAAPPAPGASPAATPATPQDSGRRPGPGDRASVR